MNRRISVLMTVYNDSDRYLKDSINSVLNQSYSEFEFVIVNDGSTDNTNNVITSFEERDSRIKYVNRKENRGRVYSLNEGLKECTGDLIFINDADDISQKYRIEESLHYYETTVKNKKKFGVLGTAFSSFQSKQNIKKNHFIMYGSFLKKTLPMWRLLIGMPFPHSSFMYSKSALLNCGGFAKEVTAGIDYLTLLKIANEYDIYGINNLLVERIVDGNNFFMQERINKLNQKNTDVILEWCRNNISYFKIKYLPKKIHKKIRKR